MEKIVFLTENKERLQAAFSREQLGKWPVLNKEEVLAAPEQVHDADYIFSTWGISRYTVAEVATLFPNIKAVFYVAGSVQEFARAFFANDIRIFSAWGANAIPVAEFSVAQIVLANKGFFQMHNRYKKDGFISCLDFCNCFDGSFRTKVGILGAGKIGSYVIRLLKAYDVEVLVFDPFLSEDTAVKLGVKKAGLEEIFTTCQTISNHLANNEQTKGMLDYSLFSKMGSYTTFINTGRGEQVIPDDLVRSMQEEPGRTALLDVTYPNEPLLSDDRIWACKNIFVSPHRAGSMTKEVRRMGEFMFSEYHHVLNNEPTEHEVFIEMLETMA